MTDPKQISTLDYTYNLPKERIASFPLEERDSSKLLIAENGSLSDDVFHNITNYLPEDSLIVFNNTRVVQARLEFFKQSGARIEIFCLDPCGDVNDVQVALMENSSAKWNCLVGNAKKWKNNEELVLQHADNDFVLKAGLIGKQEETRQVQFSWMPKEKSFAEMLELFGKTPLPPYIERKAVEQDKSRYQTIFADKNGSVAAPTAGLHFSDKVLENLNKKKISRANLTLHVGAGTFKPVSAKVIKDHSMHAEQIVVEKKALEQLKYYCNKNIISVGTTSLRTLETLYWWGVKIHNGLYPEDHYFNLDQWFPYENNLKLISTKLAIDELLSYMERSKLEFIRGETELIIVPGYHFKLVDILITNFHQPGSTLLLLVAAFFGERWKEAYQYALDNEFRFLSYGDSCLFFKSR
ncbi:MAG: S-adenosylmethionine:tRNA ribosyltransferase-isomerase [Bacteroidales bacterium]